MGPAVRCRVHGAGCKVRGAWCTVLLGLMLIIGAPAAAQERYAVIIAGASGGGDYAQQYARWTEELSKTLVERMKIDPAHVTILAENTSPDSTASAVNVRRTLARLRSMGREDVCLIVLIGHGTFDGVDAKFNLVGPDLESAEWASLVGGAAGRVVVVNTTAASFPFIERLSGPRRIVITATDSAAQRFDTVFPEHFIKAFQQDTADIDKNGRISIWEAFAAAADGVRRHYQQRGQLATERPLLDDDGDGVGKDPAANGADGSLASRTYLDRASPDAAPTDETLLKLLQRRAALEAQVEELRVRRSFLPPPEYAREFERLMIELAQVSHDIRERKGRT